VRCTNVEDCQALAEKREQRQREAAEDMMKDIPVRVTKGGVRYRDMVSPANDDTKGSTIYAANGDEVTLLYKVLKLGKRSYDGLSGEGTVVFSRGFGLEDGEKVEGDTSFVTTVGSFSNIVALNEVLAEGNLAIGVTRRFAVLPQKGWRKPSKTCDGGPGGTGAGGDVKTDFVVVPTAQLVAEEVCFDSTKQPFPYWSYGEQRRMAQRFDQSLIMEIKLVDIKKQL
jgi:hypothetical protein